MCRAATAVAQQHGGGLRNRSRTVIEAFRIEEGTLAAQSIRLFHAGVPTDRASTTSVWIYGLQQNAENRSNLALVNTGETDGSADVFRIDLFDGEIGLKVGSFETTVNAKAWKQIGAVLAQYAPGNNSRVCARDKNRRQQSIHRLCRLERWRPAWRKERQMVLL